jgi:uncharacterized protein (TIGR02466 family)
LTTLSSFRHGKQTFHRTNYLLMIQNLKIKGLDAAQFNANLYTAIMHEYNAFVEANKDVLEFAADSPQGVNHKFFEWQVTGGWNHLHKIKEAEILETIFQESVDSYLAVLGIPEEKIESRSRDIHPWATIAKLGLFHLRHAHPKNIVSGVYYVKVPPKSGSIMFEDPRGVGVEPYDNRFVVHPKEGDIILFPSFLVHEVATTYSSSERISIGNALSFILHMI